jgi:hypothetical protein
MATVCGCLSTMKIWLVSSAAAHFMPLASAPPPWLATIRHSPADTGVISAPETVQVDGVVELNDTGRPEVLVALNG